MRLGTVIKKNDRNRFLELVFQAKLNIDNSYYTFVCGESRFEKS